jgi:hypothetical protein
MNNTKNLLLVAIIAATMVMGTSVIPMQSYAESSNDKNKKPGDSKPLISASSETDKKSASQKLDQDNFCYRGDKDCQQANEGQQATGNDNVASGFNDQSTTDISSLSSIGPQGQQGPAGPKGEPGAAGPTRTAVVTERPGDAATIIPGTFGFPEASCNPGEIATGGGYRFTPSGAGVTPPHISGSRASADNLGWAIEAFNPGTSDTSVIPFAECLKLVP